MCRKIVDIDHGDEDCDTRAKGTFVVAGIKVRDVKRNFAEQLREQLEIMKRTPRN